MKAKGLRRLFLHAQSLGFSLEGHERAYHFSAPLDEELEDVLARQEVLAE
jgi:hypothetical protein